MCTYNIAVIFISIASAQSDQASGWMSLPLPLPLHHRLRRSLSLWLHRKWVCNHLNYIWNAFHFENKILPIMQLQNNLLILYIIEWTCCLLAISQERNDRMKFEKANRNLHNRYKIDIKRVSCFAWSLTRFQALSLSLSLIPAEIQLFHF